MAVVEEEEEGAGGEVVALVMTMMMMLMLLLMTTMTMEGGEGCNKLIKIFFSDIFCKCLKVKISHRRWRWSADQLRQWRWD